MFIDAILQWIIVSFQILLGVIRRNGTLWKVFKSIERVIPQSYLWKTLSWNVEEWFSWLTKVLCRHLQDGCWCRFRHSFRQLWSDLQYFYKHWLLGRRIIFPREWTWRLYPLWTWIGVVYFPSWFKTSWLFTNIQWKATQCHHMDEEFISEEWSVSYVPGKTSPSWSWGYRRWFHKRLMLSDKSFTKDLWNSLRNIKFLRACNTKKKF